jgi:hypothetical protein
MLKRLKREQRRQLKREQKAESPKLEVADGR